MKKTLFLHLVMAVVLFGFLAGELALGQQPLYRKPRNVVTRWSSFENPDGLKGRGGMENQGAKGHPSESVKAGESKTLLDIGGCGIIHRIWLGIDKHKNRSPRMLRSIRIDMYWDRAKTPAVSAPLGDFFGVGLGKQAAFENALFSRPEGRSYNCYIPMPFHRAAKIVITNESDKDINGLYYEVDYVKFLIAPPHSEDMLYFHAYWRRERPTQLGRDFEILPKVKGAGRFLGTNIGVITDPNYENTWWGEGQVKVFLDGDSEYPTLVGTGTEDYIGTGWGQGLYVNRYQGSLIADPANRQWAFYRYHIPDPVFFNRDCRVTIPQMGGWSKQKVQEFQDRGVPIKPVTVHSKDGLVKLLEKSPPVPLDDPCVPDGWCNFYRQDDYSAVAYFYLDSPENGLPPLAPVAERIAGLEK